MAQSPAQAQALRLEARIRALGGRLPSPWPWAVIKRFNYRGRKVVVDAALWNLQLLELIEDLQKQHGRQTQ